jgi:hypothetical protein
VVHSTALQVLISTFSSVVTFFDDICFYVCRLVYGLISRDKATSMLQGKCEGTFLIRFSDSQIGCLAVAFVEDTKDGLKVSHTLIDCRSQGFTIRLFDGSFTYPTLPGLLAVLWLRLHPIFFLFRSNIALQEVQKPLS